MAEPDAPNRAAPSAADVWDTCRSARLWVGGHHLGARRVIETRVTGAARPAIGPIDHALLAPKTVDEAIYFAGKLRGRLRPDGVLWIISRSDCDPPDQTGGNFTEGAAREGLEELGFVRDGELAVADGYLATRYRRR